MLAWAFACTLVRRWFRLRRDGFGRFKANYFEEGLVPLSAKDRDEMAAFSGCIACGRCNRSLAPGRWPRTNGDLMGLVLASTRSTVEFPLIAAQWSELTTEELRAAEKLCPPEIPLLALQRFVLEHAGEGRPRSADHG